jgi:hypothetical protein
VAFLGGSQEQSSQKEPVSACSGAIISPPALNWHRFEVTGLEKGQQPAYQQRLLRELLPGLWNIKLIPRQNKILSQCAPSLVSYPVLLGLHFTRGSSKQEHLANITIASLNH